MAKKNHRPHGAGSIEKRGSKFYLKSMINGKTHRTLLCNEDETPVANRTDAEKRAKELQPVLAAKTQAEVFLSAVPKDSSACSCHRSAHILKAVESLNVCPVCISRHSELYCACA